MQIIFEVHFPVYTETISICRYKELYRLPVLGKIISLTPFEGATG